MKRNFLFAFLLISVIFLSAAAVQAADYNSTADDSDCLQFENETVIQEDSSLNQTELTSQTENVYYKGYYNVTLRDSNSGGVLANKTVGFSIDSVEYSAVTDDNGIAGVSFDLMPGTYAVLAYFNGDDSYAACNFSAPLKILPTIKASSLSKYYKGSTQFSATFLTSSGEALANTYVTVTVSGKNYTKKTDSKGAVKLAVNLKPGTYKIISADPVTGYNLTTTFKILSTISAANVRQVQGQNKKFTAKFFKSNGKALANKYVKYKLSGKTYKAKTNSKGKLSLALKNFKKGKYTIVCYNRDGLSKTYTIKIYAKKASTSLTAKSYTYYLNETKKLKIQFSTALNDDSCAGKVIKIKLNGKTYSKKTDSDGIIYFKVPSLNKGLYKVQYSYGGNSFFKSSKSTKFLTLIDTKSTALKVKSTSSFGYGAHTLLKVLYAAGGVPLIKKTVTLNIDGKSYSLTTDNSGIISVPVDLNIGNYTVAYKTGDESKISGVSGSFDINVFKRSPCKVVWKCGSSYKDNSQTFKVLITDLKGNAVSDGTAELSIDGETYNASVASNGYAKFKTSVDLGKYKISVKFYGNNNLLANTTSKSINVALSMFGSGLNEKNAVATLSAYLKSSSHCKVGASAVKALVKKLTKGLTDKTDKAKAIFNYVRDYIGYSYYYNTHRGSTGTLKAKSGNCVDISHLLVAMYRTAGFKARYVHGYCHFLKSGRTCGHVWAQVYIDKTWVCADATSYGNSLGKIVNWNTKSYSIYSKYSSLPF